MPQPSMYTRMIGCIALFLSPAIAQEDVVPVSAIESIRRQSFERSRVMHYAWYLTDLHGPRLTGSPGLQAATAWAESELQGLGLKVRRSNAGRIPWGWQVTRFEGHLLQPRYSTLVGVPVAWAPATKGKISGTPIPADANCG